MWNVLGTVINARSTEKNNINLKLKLGTEQLDKPGMCILGSQVY